MRKKYLLLFALMSFMAEAQIINIPDANFKAKLLAANSSNSIAYIPYFNSFTPTTVDTNGNSEIEVNEALAIGYLNVSNSNIASLEGIQFFSNLEGLICNNNNLTTLNISSLIGLNTLNCSYNALTTLNVNSLIELGLLNCSHNALTSLNVEQVNDTLSDFDCSYNNLTSLQVPNMYHFLDFGDQTMSVNCSHNQLSNITFMDPQEELSRLDLSFNNFSSLTLPDITVYLGGSVILSDNPLTNLDLSQLFMSTSCGTLCQGVLYLDNTGLEVLTVPYIGTKMLQINNNPNLVSIDINNGSNETFMYQSGEETGVCADFYGLEVNNNPLLGLICCDVGEENQIACFVPGVQITPYCTLAPSGNFNTIAGTVNMNCPTGTPINSNIKVMINNLSNVSFTSGSNSYVTYTGLGSKIVSLQLLHPAYFTVSPANYTYNFTTYGNQEDADFCLAANGVHPDVAISILPTNTARPGFNATYDIIFTNNGTEVQSGMVNLSYNDAVLDYVLATPTVTSQATNVLSWAFSNLVPFESRTISVTLNVNSSMEIPAVNINDILNFTASITNLATDETPIDNSMDFNQTVVGSFDPNDKTVLEGSQITPTQAAGYLNYVVRFQNNGTYAAENVVIFDVLQYNKLNPSTLEFVGSSHPFTSRLSNNVLQVFYEGINLPPSSVDEPGSHGYIAFRVKPMSTSTVNNTITNTANIYFDFNFPIVTNTVSTTVTALGANDFENSLFALYPNPVESLLHIQMTNNEVVKEVGIHNALGQKLLSGSNPTTIDVSTLSKGVYFITVDTNNGKATQQFIKI